MMKPTQLLGWLALALFVGLGSASAQNAAPVASGGCKVSAVATGGTAVSPTTASVNGGYIVNPGSATDEGIGATEPLYIDPTTTATTTGNGTNASIAPGQSWFFIPQSTVPVSVNAATSGHKFTCVIW